MTFLLDVNVVDRPGPRLPRFRSPLVRRRGCSRWATCPVTENGVIRVVGHTSYPNRPGAPALVAGLVAGLRQHPGHRFWADHISLVGYDHVDMTLVKTSAQVTDTYLLALARAHGGKLATMDRRLSAAAVTCGKDALRLLDP